ncbi:MAG: hypothetical protein ACE5G0_15715 [Rhodothermales bacterium]
MQLQSLLTITGDMLHGQQNEPGAEEEGSDTLAFAAVLSGTLSLLGQTGNSSDTDGANGPHLISEETVLIPGKTAQISEETVLIPEGTAQQTEKLSDAFGGGEGLLAPSPDFQPASLNTTDHVDTQARSQDAPVIAEPENQGPASTSPQTEGRPSTIIAEAVTAVLPEQDASVSPESHSSQALEAEGSNHEAVPEKSRIVNIDVPTTAKAEEELIAVQDESIDRQAGGPRIRFDSRDSTVRSQVSSAKVPHSVQELIAAQDKPIDLRSVAPVDAEPVDASEETPEEASPSMIRQGVRDHELGQAGRPRIRFDSRDSTVRSPASSAKESHSALQEQVSDQDVLTQARISSEAADPGGEAVVASEGLDGGNSAVDIEGFPPEHEAKEEASSPSSRREGLFRMETDEGDTFEESGDDARSGRSRSDGKRAARRLERTDSQEESPVVQKASLTSTESIQTSEKADLDAVPAERAQPEALDGASVSMPDGEQSLPAFEENLVAAGENTTRDASGGSARATRSSVPQHRAVPAAWLRAVLSNARQMQMTEDGWKVLEMDLDEGDGTVTIKARREDGRVAVAVGFSDPDLRALASIHADRLQEVLQAEYETAVDFSLFNGDSGNAGEQRQAEGTGGRTTTGGVDAGTDDATSGDRSSRRTLPAGARHEWIG